MQFEVITGFPNFFNGPLNESIIRKSVEKGFVEINIYDLRKYTDDKHKRIDDYPYGGGPGMVLKPEPIFKVYENIIKDKKIRNFSVINFSPTGIKLEQSLVKRLVKKKGFIIICGHYKGIDQRVIDSIVDMEISIGDYILTGGEIPCLIFIDTIIRLLPNVLGNEDSYRTDTFFNGNVDCSYYTRPPVFRDMKVPDVLLSGNHKEIENWRKEQSEKLRKKLKKNLR